MYARIIQDDDIKTSAKGRKREREREREKERKERERANKDGHISREEIHRSSTGKESKVLFEE